MEFHTSNHHLFLIIFEQSQEREGEGEREEAEETIYAIAEKDLSAFKVMNDFLLSRNVVLKQSYVIQRSDFFAQAENVVRGRWYRIKVSKEAILIGRSVMDIG